MRNWVTKTIVSRTGIIPEMLQEFSVESKNSTLYLVMRDAVQDGCEKHLVRKNKYEKPTMGYRCCRISIWILVFGQYSG